jgi:hypothetical protein
MKLFAGIGLLGMIALGIQGCSPQKSESSDVTEKPQAKEMNASTKITPGDEGKKMEGTAKKAVTTPAEKREVLGDMDDDGKVTSKDAKIATNIAVGKTEATRKQMEAGDLNGDGKISINEATAILRSAKKGIPVRLPTAKP